MSNRFFFYEWQRSAAIPQDGNQSLLGEQSRDRGERRGAASDSAGSRTGQIVTLNGYLVNATGPGGRTWNSWLTREDLGNGACELFYVENAKAVSALAEEL